MELYLMQHGANLGKEVDPEEPLSPEGREQIRASAKALDILGVRLNAIVASPKKRSRESAMLVAERLGFPKDAIRVTETVKPMAPPDETVRYLQQGGAVGALLIVGHLPSLSEIASFLLTEGSKANVTFARGGVARIDVDVLPTHAGRLQWLLTPRQLKLIASSDPSV